MRLNRSFGIPLAISAAAMLVAGCASGDIVTTYGSTAAAARPVALAGADTADAMPGMVMGDRQQAVGPAGASSPATAARLDLTIVTGDMIGHTEFPAFVPSDFTLPANAIVKVTITNFDDATPLPRGSEQYAKVSGTTDGAMSVTPIKVTDPNSSAGKTQTLTGLNPAVVSHTFTIPALGINVPIAAHAQVTFTIHTGAPGTFMWRCFDPCGAGPDGWGTAMAAMRGYMEGTLTVA